MAQKVIVPQKKNYVPQFLKQRDINSYFLISFLLASWRSVTKIAGSGSGSGSGSISQRHGSADPDLDPHQNIMDPQHCLKKNQMRLDKLFREIAIISCPPSIPWRPGLWASLLRHGTREHWRPRGPDFSSSGRGGPAQQTDQLVCCRVFDSGHSRDEVVFLVTKWLSLLQIFWHQHFLKTGFSLLDVLLRRQSRYPACMEKIWIHHKKTTFQRHDILLIFRVKSLMH